MENRQFDIPIERGAVDDQQCSIEMSFSSEIPVERYGEFEILTHSDEAVDMSRMETGAPLLLNHNQENQIGVVDKAWIDKLTKKGRAVVRFSKEDDAQKIFREVQDGIRRNVSVGYQINKSRIESRKGYSKPIMIVENWTPMEVSIVSVPADSSVGVGRSMSENSEAGGEPAEVCEKNKQEQERMETNTTTATPQAAPDYQAETARVRETETGRIRDIRAMGKAHNMAEVADEAIATGKTVDQFRGILLDEFSKKKPETPAGNPIIGMNDKQARQYSFVKALRAMVYPDNKRFNDEAGFEREMSTEVCKRMGKDGSGFFVPFDVLVRGNTPMDSVTYGGGAISANLMPGAFIEKLEKELVSTSLGVRTMPGLVGTPKIPRKTAGTTAYWLAAETNDITNGTTPTVDQVTLNPHTVGVYTDINHQLLTQNDLSAEMIVRDDIAFRLAEAIDAAVFNGSNSAGQPKGIITYDTALAEFEEWATDNTATWAEIVALETKVAENNGLRGSPAYVGAATILGSMKTVPKATYGEMIMSNGQVNGYRCVLSNQLSAGGLLFGNFAEVILGMWGALNLMSNPYTGQISGTVRISGMMDVDVLVRQPLAFAYISNTAT
jgi:HK97 family phage major capsid protein